MITPMAFANYIISNKSYLSYNNKIWINMYLLFKIRYSLWFKKS